MSHYISSFLIEPVIRQARRLSRPSLSTREASIHDLATTPPTAADGAKSFLAFRTPSFTLQNFLGNHCDAVSSSSLPEVPCGRHDFGASDTPLQLFEVENLEPAIEARRYLVRPVTGLVVDNTHAADQSPDLDLSTPFIHGSLESTDNYDAQQTPLLRDVESIAGNDVDRIDRSLPADDGMSQIRKRILMIQQSDALGEVKARLIYDLMTENHRASQQHIHPRAQSPASLPSSGRPYTPSSPKSVDSLNPPISPPTSSSSLGEQSNPFNLVPQDFRPTFWERPSNGHGDSGLGRPSLDSESGDDSLGCAHYKRNIKLQCFACSRWYPCRFCHDAIEDHNLNRRETKRMLCMLCGCAQPAGHICVLCGNSAAYYYCDVCKLWDDDSEKRIYHCPDCGICRLGEGLGRSHLHCKVCCQISHSKKKV